MSNIKTGKDGEKIAVDFLIKNGYQILETNKHFSRYCEIDIIAYDNNILVRDFVPCYRKEDGVIGLCDVVTQEFYENQGTGNFKKGEDIED